MQNNRALQCTAADAKNKSGQKKGGMMRISDTVDNLKMHPQFQCHESLCCFS